MKTQRIIYELQVLVTNLRILERKYSMLITDPIIFLFLIKNKMLKQCREQLINKLKTNIKKKL